MQQHTHLTNPPAQPAGFLFYSIAKCLHLCYLAETQLKPPMDTPLEQLRKQAEALFEKEQYNQLIDELLRDDILEQYKDAVLYTYKGRALDNLGLMEEAFAYANKAIEIDDKYYLPYRTRGNYFGFRGEHDKELIERNKAIHYNSGEPDAVDYYNRGNSWYSKGDHDRAIADYSKAIELKNDDSDAYNNRGNAWDDKGEYDKAIADFSKAIELKKDYSSAYNNRGIVWKNKGDYNNAIADYSKAIELKNDYALAYRNRGLLYEENGKTKEAKEDYENAVKYNPNDAYAKSLLDKLLATLGKPVELSTDDVDETFYKIRKALDNVSAEDCIKIMQFYEDSINPVIEKIRAHAATTEKVWEEALGAKYEQGARKYVAHYTSLKTADILVMKQAGTDDNTRKAILSPLRYSNAIFMNDPEEGAILISCLGKLERGDEKESTIVQAFQRALKEEKTNFYIGSFLPMVKNHEDELLMWRTYGKDENLNEAAGCCLLFDIGFFDKHDGKNIATRDDDKPATASHPLFKVLYFDRRNNEFTGGDGKAIATDVKELKDVLLRLLEMKDGNEELNIAIDKVLYHSLSELRYFFKSSDYSYESELRVIQFATHADVVKIDETGTPPRKMYIESTKSIKPYLRKIVLGPKVQHPDRWAYLAEKMRRDGYYMEMSHSTCHFR